jgi:hypothetical protein
MIFYLGFSSGSPFRHLQLGELRGVAYLTISSTTWAGTSRFSSSVYVLHACKVLRHNSLWFLILPSRNIRDSCFPLLFIPEKMRPSQSCTDIFLWCCRSLFTSNNMYLRIILAACMFETRIPFSVDSPFKLMS